MSESEHDIDELRLDFSSRLTGWYSLAMAAKQILDRIIPADVVVTISNRVKSFDSFFDKASRKEESKLKYKKPFKQITDVVGLRIVVLAKRNVAQVCEIIRASFDVLEEEDKAASLLNEGRLGYESHHFVVKLGDDRSKLGEYSEITAIPFEIQVRTALQHTWAENEHRIQYKKSKDPELTKRFLRLAAAISSADEEFDRIYEIDQKIQGQLEESVSSAAKGEEGPKVEGKAARKRLAEISNRFGVRPADLVKQGRLSEALIVYDDFIETQPNQASHYIGRARVFLLLGDLLSARIDFEKAKELAPNTPPVEKMQTVMDKFFRPDVEESGEGG